MSVKQFTGAVGSREWESYEPWDFIGYVMAGTFENVEVALGSVAVALLLGALAAWGRLVSRPWLNLISGAYSTVVRGLPDLVLMLLVYYGLKEALNRNGLDFRLDGFATGVLVLGFIYGAYLSEAFRGAYLAVSRIQLEAALACGMSRTAAFRVITWPQLVGLALPGFTNTWLVLLKATALVHLLGRQDLVWRAQKAGQTTGNQFVFMLVTFGVYLALTAVSGVFLRLLARRYRVATTGG